LLYLLVIIVASILFSRRIAFLTAANLFLLLRDDGAAYAEKIPRTFSSLPMMESLRTWLVMNLLGFFGGLSGQPPGPVSSQEGRWSSKRSAGTSQPSGFHRRHIHSMRVV